jgi:hypothetical protein
MSEKARYASVTATRFNDVTTIEWLQRPGEPADKSALLLECPKAGRRI